MECSGTRLSLCNFPILVSRLEVTLTPYALFHLFVLERGGSLCFDVYP